MESLNCPKCNKDMQVGYLAWYEASLISKLVFQKVKPGYMRLRAPKDSVKVLRPPTLGKGDPEAYFCESCKFVCFESNN